MTRLLLPVTLLTLILLPTLVLPAAAQILTVEQTPWEAQPVLKRWHKTVTITYVPKPPDAGDDIRPRTGPPLGYIERLYCNMDPNYSPRCGSTAEERPSWDLTVTFPGNGPFAANDTLYTVHHSSGRGLNSGTSDVLTLPYGIVTQRYYMTTQGRADATPTIAAKLRLTAVVNPSGDSIDKHEDLEELPARPSD